jgi:hypothetical protein
MSNVIPGISTDFVTPDDLDASIGVPTLIADGETFIVPENRQVLIAIPITIEDGGTLEINGELIEV